MAVAIVCAAVASQAATVNWTCSGINNTNGEGVSGLAYLFATTNFAVSDAIALAGTGAESVIAAMTKVDNYGAAWTVTDGKATTFTTSDRINISTMNLTEGGIYSFYAVVFDTATITDDSKFYVTSVKEGLAMGEGSANKVVALGKQSNTEGMPTGEWYAVSDVPEPTSALMLLVGLAGLALKRKIA